jgi:hypothetical protein
LRSSSRPGGRPRHGVQHLTLTHHRERHVTHVERSARREEVGGALLGRPCAHREAKNRGREGTGGGSTDEGAGHGAMVPRDRSGRRTRPRRQSHSGTATPAGFESGRDRARIRRLRRRRGERDW